MVVVMAGTVVTTVATVIAKAIQLDQHWGIFTGIAAIGVEYWSTLGVRYWLG